MKHLQTVPPTETETIKHTVYLWPKGASIFFWSLTVVTAAGAFWLNRKPMNATALVGAARMRLKWPTIWKYVLIPALWLTHSGERTHHTWQRFQAKFGPPVKISNMGTNQNPVPMFSFVQMLPDQSRTCCTSTLSSCLRIKCNHLFCNEKLFTAAHIATAILFMLQLWRRCNKLGFCRVLNGSDQSRKFRWSYYRRARGRNPRTTT